LEETESNYDDFVMHCNVWWLSAGNVLSYFINWLDEIKIFLQKTGVSVFSKDKQP